MKKREIVKNQLKVDENNLNFLFNYKGNIEVLMVIKKYIVKTKVVNSKNLVDKITEQEAINSLALSVINKEFFDILLTVYLFENDAIKCLRYIKGRLKRYELNYANFLKSLIVKGLNNKKRFENQSIKLIFIREELSQYNCSDLIIEDVITCNMFEYFTGKQHYNDFNFFTSAYLSVRGFLKTKSQEVKEYIANNKNEILKQLKNHECQVQNEIIDLSNTKETENVKKLVIELKNIEKELVTMNLNTSFIPINENLNKSIEYKSKRNNLKTKFNSIFEILISKQVSSKNKYFEFSSFNNYKNRINELMSDFKTNYIDSNKIDFYKDQLIGYKEIIPNDLLGLQDKISLSTKSKIRYSNNRKIEYLEGLLKTDKNKNLAKPHPKYCEIGSLFAQGFIHKKGFNFYYKELKFEDCSKLSRYLKNEILNIKTDIRQYIDGTLKEQTKNFYKSKIMMRNIIDYCKFNNIEITEDFQSKYNDLVNLH